MNRRERHCIRVLLIILSLWAVKAHAQSYQARYFNAEDGLPGNMVSDIAQDASGRIWFLTESGLTRYNGTDWMPFPNAQGLPTSQYSKLIPLPDTSMLVIGFDDVNIRCMLWKNGSWRSIPIDNSKTSFSPHARFAVQAWLDGPEQSLSLLISGHQEIRYLNEGAGGQWQSFPFPKSGFICLGLHRTPQGAVLVSSNRGIYQWSEKEGISEHPYNRLLPESTSISGLIERADTCYLLGETWLGRIAESRFEILVEAVDREPHAIMKQAVLAADDRGNVFFSNSSQLYFFSTKVGALRRITFRGVRNAPIPSSIMIDRDSRLWVASKRGAAYFPSLKFANYTSLNALLEDDVSGLLQTKDGRMVVATNSGYTIRKNGKWRQYPFFDDPSIELRNKRILSMDEDKDGNIYMAYFGKGLGRLSPDGSLQWLLPPNHPRPVEVTAVKFHQDTLFVVCASSLYAMHKGKWTEIFTLDTSFLRRIVVLQSGEMLLLGNGGVIPRNQPGKKIRSTTYKKNNVFDALEINGEIFLGTDAGLSKIQGDSIVQAFMFNNTIVRPIYELFQDSKGKIWIGTDNGIYVVEGEKMRRYSTTDGLIGDEINRGAVLEATNGDMLIGTDKGLSIFLSDMADQPPLTPSVYISAVHANEKSYRLNSLPEKLSYEENNFRFDYRALCFDRADVVRFRVCLKGLDADWVYLSGKQQSISYSNLSPGQYQFMVQTRIADGPWSETASTIPFLITTPFFQTSWFYTLLVLGFLLAGVVISLVITKTRNEKILKRTVEEKTKEIQASSDALARQNEELRKVNAELDRFVYSTSHDLRAPLASIGGLVALMKNNPSQEDANTFLDMMDRSVQRLDNFIGEIVDFSRNARTTIKVEPVYFEQLVANCFDALEYAIQQKKIAKFVEIEEGIEIYSDPNRIATVLNNLLSNAVRYSDPRKEDSYVWVRVRSVTLPETGVLIQVEDNGIGIGKEYLPRIFEMFYRATDTNHGSGLGLYIVKEVLAKVQGSIEVASETRKGTTFSVFLPDMRQSGIDQPR